MQILKQGHRGDGVVALQKLLGLTTDGVFGPATQAAVMEAQRKHDLVVDGVVGPKTWTALNNKDTGHLLRQDDLKRAATELGVPLASVMAINAVESNGTGFLKGLSGLVPVILFERHIMYRRLKALIGIDADRVAKEIPNLVSPARGGYRGGAEEHDRLFVAQMLHYDSAIESASWGLFQIMGFHWSTLGYSSAQHFMSAMSESEGAQLDAFVRFIKNDARLHRALIDRDWPRVAEIYNGPAYRDHKYDERLKAAFERFAGLSL